MSRFKAVEAFTCACAVLAVVLAVWAVIRDA